MMKFFFPSLLLNIVLYSYAFSQSGTAMADSTLKSTDSITSPVPLPAAEVPPVVVLVAEPPANVTEPTAITPVAETAPAAAFFFKPWVGLGVGLFTFYGDVRNKKLAKPQQSQMAYELSISKDLTSFLNLKFYTLFGRMAENERSTGGRNLNFETQVRMGGMIISYNFDRVLPKKHSIEPYLFLGFESFEFLSKTDLYDKNGNRYYFWSDGSIKNLSETDPNAVNAIQLVRDYTYESDIRELNADGFGKYAERTWAVPVGAGVTLLLNERVRFKIGTTLHYTFTDFVDGISVNSVGSRKGDAKNDRFIMNSFSLHYDLTSAKGREAANPPAYLFVDWYALEMEDHDGDGIKDPEDSCQGTPAGVPVDMKGCPLDGDKDGVSDFADKQLDSPLNSIIDKNGVAQTDSLIEKKWLKYSDSTYLDRNIVVNPVASWLVRKPKAGKFTVRIATYTSTVPADAMGKLLTVPDITSITLPDSSAIYTVGSFFKFAEAEKRKSELQQQGFSDAAVVYSDGDKYAEVTDSTAAVIATTAGNTTVSSNTITTSSSNLSHVTDDNTLKRLTTSALNIPLANDDGTVIRVQLGAYKKPLSKNIFNEVPNLVVVKTENGMYKYLSGSFKSVDQALRHRAMLVERGYHDAFVAAYKEGKKVPLPVNPNSTTNFEGAFDPKDPTDPTKVSFNVQVGVFKNSPPADIQKKFNEETSISSEITEANLTRYVSGSFVDYESAQKHKDELIKKGFEDAFINAYYKGKIIPVQEALLILKSH